MSALHWTIEARALSLIEETPALTEAQKTTGVRIPRLLHHDQDNNILIIEDLGTGLLLLDEWLATPAVADTASRRRQTPPSDSEAVVRNVGERLGKLLASLHGMKLSDEPEALQEFVNPTVSGFIAEEVVGKMSGYLEKYTNLEANRKDRICSLIQTDFEEGNSGFSGGGNGDARERPGVFSVGDLWTGSILVSENAERIGLIDFEFAGKARPLQDMAQLGAHLHLQAIAMASRNLKESSSSSLTVTTFVKALYAAYHSHSRELEVFWLQDGDGDDNDSVNNEDHRRAVRSAWILHGREMIYNAIGRDWGFYSSHCGSGDAIDVQEIGKAEIQKKMMEKGVWYVEMAHKIGSEEAEGEDFLKPLYHQ
ncbi:hypothetical protein D9758_014194 [Tetrapyrgos nigripes]|uniref:Aminoglycoside phosphotransferase domain-containing protein n=1 Tax=Tetrapyrgos nigripes TaxID=182062 RepID=A0A8H5CMG5_9AGAR|nr:hypothetical protein D9758_014194 [Tetrapyrgos nigripes]